MEDYTNDSLGVIEDQKFVIHMLGKQADLLRSDISLLDRRRNAAFLVGFGLGGLIVGIVLTAIL